MTSFELVFALVTIITSLALTHLLAGFVWVLRNVQRVEFSARRGRQVVSAASIALLATTYAIITCNVVAV